jgi:xylose isomerase
MPLQDLRPQAARRSPDQLLAHLRSFRLQPRFSAGIWFFSPAASRFHAKYAPDLSIEQRLDLAAPLAADGLVGLEAHYPNEINEDNLPLWQSFTKATGIRLITVIPLLFYDPDFEFGSLSNPDPAIRKKAIDRTAAALRLNKQLDTDFAVVWPGIDGYELGFGLDFAAARDRFAQGLAQAMDAAPGVRIAFEPKPYEPRGRILFGTTPEGILLGHQVESLLRAPANTALLKEGHALCCMNPEVGHVLMGFEDAPYAFSWPLSQGRLAHTHWNSQPLGNYDQDLGVGVVSPEVVEGILYTLMIHAYDQHLGIDINPERCPVDVAVRNSMHALRRAAERVASLDHELILAAHARPAATRGSLESYLNKVRWG